MTDISTPPDDAQEWELGEETVTWNLTFPGRPSLLPDGFYNPADCLATYGPNVVHAHGTELHTVTLEYQS